MVLCAGLPGCGKSYLFKKMKEKLMTKNIGIKYVSNDECRRITMN